MKRGLGPTAFCLLASGCFPSFEDRPWLVDKPRVLAVRGLPAEARPGAAVRYEALLVSPTGSLGSELDWAYCTEPRRAEERTSITASCADGQALVSIQQETVVLGDACARFGPNTPPAPAGESPRRPADADPSGGYYLPVYASSPEASAFGAQRLHCDLAGATRDVFEEYQERYERNEHPVISTLHMGETDLLSSVAELGTGSTALLDFTAGEGSEEDFVVYLPDENRLDDRREKLTPTWYFSGGELESSDASSARWRAPPEAGRVHGWVILRDDRGGSTWAEFAIAVRPL